MLLAAIHKEEARQQRGNLKIFFGMVAGVGKTYAMLEGGPGPSRGDRRRHWLRGNPRAGRDRRPGHGLASLPRRKLEYRGTVLEEMDLDAIWRANRRWPW